MKKFLFSAAFLAACINSSFVRASKTKEVERLESFYRNLNEIEESVKISDLCYDYGIYSLDELQKRLTKEEISERISIMQDENTSVSFLRINNNAVLRDLYRQRSELARKEEEKNKIEAEKAFMSAKREEEKDSLTLLGRLVLSFNNNDDKEMLKSMKEFNRSNKGRPEPFRLLGDHLTKTF